SMKGSVVYADGKIVFRHENGPVTLLAANSRKYQELGRFEQPDRSDKPAWAHPVIADGRLYLRDMDKLLVYNLK
ncbi:MAG: polyvinylalcohol dehydrogenase, partial [Phycisphaerae bacterium]